MHSQRSINKGRILINKRRTRIIPGSGRVLQGITDLPNSSWEACNHVAKRLGQSVHTIGQLLDAPPLGTSQNGLRFARMIVVGAKPVRGWLQPAAGIIAMTMTPYARKIATILGPVVPERGIHIGPRITSVIS